MFSIADILERILTPLKQQDPEPVGLLDALGRVASCDVRSNFTLPAIDLCTVDGYAIRCEDVMQLPTLLTRVGKSRPGKLFEGMVGPGETVYVLAGTPVPEGADAVVCERDVERNGVEISITEQVMDGVNISTAGIDVCGGDIVMKRGTIITARHVALCAAVKVPWLSVIRKPRIGILVNADESSMNSMISENSVTVSHAIGVALSAFVNARGGIPINLGSAVSLSASVEEIVVFKERIRNALKGIDMLVATGGINDLENSLMWTMLSDEDAVLERMSVGIGRGESVIVGYQGTTPIVGLSGNPVSSLICASLFIRPAIDYMLGVANDRKGPKDFALLSRNLDVVDRQADYLYATLKRKDNGDLIVTPFSAQDTLMVSVLAKADCLVVVDKNLPLLSGTMVETINFSGSITST
jgi:molybdopterin molybdotransferase